MDERKAVVKEIISLLETLPSEDLSFLKNQAEVLLHNRNVIESSKAEESGSDDKTPAVRKRKSPKKAPAPKTLRIEQSDNPRYFNICAGDSRIFMDRHEIKALFKIAEAAADAAEAGPRLYRWLKRERSDVLGDAHVSGSGSPVLGELYKALLDNFTAG